MTELATLTQEVLGAFFLGGLLLGAISQRTHFCTKTTAPHPRFAKVRLTLALVQS